MLKRFESVIADLRFGARHFGHRPISTVTMILVFALGIGFNSALFVFVYSLLNSPPPGIERDAAVVRIRGIDRSSGPGLTSGREFSYPEYEQYAEQRELFSTVAAWTSADVVLDVGSAQESLHSGAATYVTANYFQVLGVRPILGAGLPANAGAGTTAQHSAVISYVVWERHFGLAPDVVGRTLKVNGVPVTVTGVAPRRFAGARTGGSQVRVWLPLDARPTMQRTSNAVAAADDSPVFGLIARLRPDVDIERTLPAVQTIAARVNGQTSPGPDGSALSTDVVPLRGDNYFPPSGETPGIAGRAATALIPVIILLITCTNVSAQVAGIAVARRREIAIRLSLGAPRRRIVRQLVTESVLLALAAGLLGLFLIWVLLRLFDTRVPDVQLILDWPALLFTAGFAIATGILFGISPALHATRLALSEALKDTAGTFVPSRPRLQSALVVAQIAFTQPALLAMGALTLEMTADFRALPAPAFSDRLLEVRFNTNPRYGSIDQNREATLRRLQQRLATVPGVVGVVPQENADDFFPVAVHQDDRVPGADSDSTFMVRAEAAPAGYFRLVGIPVVRGRDFAAGGDDSRAIVVGGDVARQLWGSADPIGRRLTSAGPNQRGTLFTVVGVVDEQAAGASGGDTEVRIYVPDVRVTGHLLIRTEGPAEAVVPVIRSVANSEAPELSLVSARTRAAIDAEQRSTIMRVIAAIGGSGLLALLLSAIGLYAVVAFAVGQRVREIGIRSALGAGPRQVVGMFVWRGVRLSLIGLLAGLSLSIVALRVMASLQGQEPPAGTLWLSAVTASVVTAVALLATWTSARRAARIDPLDALRLE